jgi:hypothetical protein
MGVQRIQRSIGIEGDSEGKQRLDRFIRGLSQKELEQL